MKTPFGIFAQDGNEIKFLAPASVRASRANKKALEYAATYPGVFYARVSPSNQPIGEHFKPKRMDWRRLNQSYASQAEKRRAEFQRANRAQLSKNMTREVNERVEHRRRKNHKPVDYNEVDPVTGESLNDVMVDVYRARLARKLKGGEEADVNLL